MKWWKKIFSLNILVLFVFNSRRKYWPIDNALSLKFAIEVAREGVGDIDWRGRATEPLSISNVYIGVAYHFSISFSITEPIS